LAIRHKHTCSHCQREFEWIEFTAQHISEPAYDVVDLSRVGETMPKDGGGFYVVAKCEHCGHDNQFDA
jgi:hypothetical protein